MTEALVLLPQPRALARHAGQHQLDGARRIALDGAVAPLLLGAAQRLQASLRAAAPGAWPIVAFDDGDPAVAVSIRIDPAQATRPQGYQLAITPERITITARDPAGAFYGAATLIQLAEARGAQLPCLAIDDWPDFAARGVMLDISRDKVPTLETLFGLVDMLAGWKVNQLQLYTEHTFAYTRHPEVWAAASPMTGEDVLRLDAYCRERFVELVPNQNTFGHMERWLMHPRYAALAETHDEFDTPWNTRMRGPFSLCPGDPGSIALVRDMLGELLPHFASRMVNIGCDETVDLGQGRSREEVARRGEGPVYLDFLRQVLAEARAHGRTPQFWGDIIVQHPELIPELPRDTIALEWGYEASHPFAEHGARFAASGIPFYVCPGTSAWCSIAGRTDNALGNLRSAAEHGLSHGASGYLNTDWGDRGHWQALPVSYLGLAAGAAYGWALAANRALDLPAALDRFAFGDTAGVAGQLAYGLGNIYRAAGVEPPNSSALFWALQMPAAEAHSSPLLAQADFEAALEATEQAAALLPALRLARPDAALLARELAQTARLLRHACMRGLYMHAPDAGAARALAADMREIIEEYRAVWLARNRPGGLGDSVARLERAMRDYAT